MRISSKFRLFAVCLTAVGAMSVAGAGAASAAPAVFNVSGSGLGVMSGSLSVTNGTKTTTCNVVNRKLQAFNNSGQGFLATNEIFVETTTCANGGVFSLNFISPASNTGSGFLVTNAWNTSSRSPFPYGGFNYYSTAAYAIPYVNGSGATESTLVLNETTLGTMPAGGGTIKATGTLKVRKTDGSLLLLS